MTEFAIQSALVLGILATAFVGPSLAITFLVLRKKRRRARRRSPINIDLLRPPGHTLKGQVDEASSDLTWDVLTLSLIPLTGLTVFLAQAHLTGLSRSLNVIWIYLVSVVGFIIWMIRKLIKAGESLDHLRAGYDAELAVGQELDQLMLKGAAVFHDFPAENFNIDHVVISAQGVFAVETKGYTKSGDMPGKEAARVVFDGHTLK